MSDGPEWFAAKRYGFGAGLPIAWQGWLLTIGYVGLVSGSLLVLGERSPAAYALAIIATALFLLIASRTTRGGWRWRWGKRD